MKKQKNGFALISALMAILVLAAAGILVFTVSTQDIRISSRIVGEKKAHSAARAGIHQLTRAFDPDNTAAVAVSDQQVNAVIDPESRYTIGNPARPASGPMTVPMAGYAIGGGQQWGQARYMVRVSGANTRYASNVQVDAGIGYGPVEITTTYR